MNTGTTFGGESNKDAMSGLSLNPSFPNLLQTRGRQTFPGMVQIINGFGSVGHGISVTTTQLGHYSAEQHR